MYEGSSFFIIMFLNYVSTPPNLFGGFYLSFVRYLYLLYGYEAIPPSSEGIVLPFRCGSVIHLEFDFHVGF